jgi:hypothetical protein
LVPAWLMSVVMGSSEAGSFDPETITFLQTVLDETWAKLSPDARASHDKGVLAARILKLAGQGERDPNRLRSFALMDVVTRADSLPDTIAADDRRHAG